MQLRLSAIMLKTTSEIINLLRIEYTKCMQTFIRLLADGLMLPIIVIAAYALIWCVPNSVRYKRYTFILMAGISSYAIAKIIGLIWQPEQLRPFERLGVDPGAAYLNNPGFPSDHALIAFFLVGAVWYATRHRALTITVLCLTLIMCGGRVLALVHTPVDIIGSLIAATVGAIWYYDPGYAKKSPRIYMAKPAKK